MLITLLASIDPSIFNFISLHCCVCACNDHRHLVKNGRAGVNEIDNQGRPPLHYIINSRLKGSAECIEFLLGDDCKADINMADTDGYTALHKAAHSRKVKRVNQLIKSDANLCARTNGEDGTSKKGKSAINFIMKYSPQSVKAIEQVGPLT